MANPPIRNYLDEDCEHDDNDTGGDKKFFTKNSLWKGEN